MPLVRFQLPHSCNLIIYLKIKRKKCCAELDDIQIKMDKTVELFANSIVGIRIGTVSSSLVDSVKVDYYGQSMPLKHLANTGKINNGIFVDPYDNSIIGKINNTLKDNGFSSYCFSKDRIMISIPPVSGEEKTKIHKHISKLAEDAKIAIRNIRKGFRKIHKDDDDFIQAMTDKAISEINTISIEKIESI